MHKNGWEKRLGFFMRRCTLAVMLSAVLAVEMTAFSAWGEESAEGRESAAEERDEEAADIEENSTEDSKEAETVLMVEYENLRQLLLDGNLDLQKANDSYETTKKNYQELMEQMREEQAYMKFLAEKYEDTEDGATYSVNAGILGGQANMM